MPVEIKLLRGFKNPINNENNSMSLLVKSDLDLKEHLISAEEKLRVSLNSIFQNYYSNHITYFYHKLQVLYENKKEHLCSKTYFTDIGNLKRDLNASLKETLRIAYGKKISHFVNVTIRLNDHVIELSQEEFKDLNLKLRSDLSKMNDKKALFVDYNNEDLIIPPPEQFRDGYKPKPLKKKEKNNSKPIKKETDDSLFIDDDDDENAKKTVNVKPSKKALAYDCLFIDDDNDENAKKAVNVKPLKKKPKKPKKTVNIKPLENNNSSDSPVINNDDDDELIMRLNDELDRLNEIHGNWCDHGRWFN